MIGLDVPDDALPRLVGVDVQRVQELAVIPQRGEITRLARIRQGGLDPEIEEPGVGERGRRIGQKVGQEPGDVWVHFPSVFPTRVSFFPGFFFCGIFSSLLYFGGTRCR